GGEKRWGGVPAVLPVKDGLARPGVDGDALGEVGIPHRELRPLDAVLDGSARRRPTGRGAADEGEPAGKARQGRSQRFACHGRLCPCDHSPGRNINRRSTTGELRSITVTNGPAPGQTAFLRY